MLQCIHRCCRTCATEYFMLQIRDHPVIDLTCPFCKEPSDLNDDPELATNDYFSQLDVLLKDLLSERYYEMFQRKLRDWALSKMPNFKWCSKVSLPAGLISRVISKEILHISWLLVLFWVYYGTNANEVNMSRM